MIGLVLILFIALLTLISGVVASKGPLYNENRKGIDYFTANGKLVIILGLSIVVLSGAQYLYGEQKADQDRKNAEVASNKRDSILREDYQKSVVQIKDSYDTTTKRLKSSYDTSTTNIVKALAQYGLKYDSARHTIEKLVENSTGSPDPDFGFCLREAIKEKDSSFQKRALFLNFCNQAAPANNINVMCYGVNHYANGAYTLAGVFDVIPKNSRFSANESRGVTIISTDWTSPTRHLFVLIKGTYTNNSGTKTYPINEIIVYDFVNKTTGASTPYFDSKVREVLKTHGII